jgi:hypothetical protein
MNWKLMNKKLLYLLGWLVIFPALLNAQDLTQKFPAGKGSIFNLDLQNGSPPVSLSIYVASSTRKSVHVEYFMELKAALIPIQMWQQFEIEIKSNGPTEIITGFIQTKELKRPEILPQDLLKGVGEVKVNDFLFASQQELDKNKIGTETLNLPAGKTTATHYRTVSNGVTLDYWISQEAKPIGLVKLISRSQKHQHQNYQLELSSLIDNIKAHIDPAQAQPLSPTGKALLTGSGHKMMIPAP